MKKFADELFDKNIKTKSDENITIIAQDFENLQKFLDENPVFVRYGAKYFGESWDTSLSELSKSKNNKTKELFLETANNKKEQVSILRSHKFSNNTYICFS